MSATDELRRMLDERGVEWGNIRNDGSESDYLTEWQFEDNQGKAIAIEWAVGSGLSVETHRYHLTPEQAIAATLGDADATPARQVDAGTCHDMGGCRWFRCSACGFGIEDMYVNDEDEYPPADQPRYCPNCGRLVVEVDA